MRRIMTAGLALVALAACGEGGDTLDENGTEVPGQGGAAWFDAPDPYTSRDFRCLVLRGDSAVQPPAIWCYEVER